MATNRRIPALEYFSWQPPVISSSTLTPPGAPTKGDRYLINGVGAGGWVGKDNNIAWYDGTEWQYDIPADGWITYVLDLNLFYVMATTWASLVIATSVIKYPEFLYMGA